MGYVWMRRIGAAEMGVSAFEWWSGQGNQSGDRVKMVGKVGLNDNVIPVDTTA